MTNEWRHWNGFWAVFLPCSPRADKTILIYIVNELNIKTNRGSISAKIEKLDLSNIGGKASKTFIIKYFDLKAQNLVAEQKWKSMDDRLSVQNTPPLNHNNLPLNKFFVKGRQNIPRLKC